jgi:hypothetical protein
MTSRKIIGALYFLVCCTNFSCSQEKASIRSTFSNDSLVADILRAKIAAMTDAQTKVHVPDYNYLLPNEDTVFIKDELLVDKNRGTQNAPVEFLTLNSKFFLVVKEIDRSYCTFTIYNNKRDSVGICYLPVDAAIKLVHRDTDDLKVYFYDMHERILRKYNLRLCEKYGITEDELDSLSSLTRPEIDRIRREFNVNID